MEADGVTAAIFLQQPDQLAKGSTPGGKAEQQQHMAQECEWSQHTAALPEDPSVAVTYFYNARTGQSQYEMPAEYAAWLQQQHAQGATAQAALVR